MVSFSIYDLDRTLTRRGTWLPWLVFWARREAPWRLLLLTLAVPAALGAALGWVGRGRLKEIVQRLVMGRPDRTSVVAAAEAFADELVATGLFPGALAALASDRAAGRQLVLATASNQFYAEEIGRRLGFAAVIASPSRWDGDLLSPRLAGANNYGAAKAARVNAFITASGGGAFRFTSDHVSDLPAFEAALAGGGEAVAANPSKALRQHAVARGWRIVDWGTPEPSWFERA